MILFEQFITLLAKINISLQKKRLSEDLTYQNSSAPKDNGWTMNALRAF